MFGNVNIISQVQIVVYETHSRLELENGGMVKAAVEEMNGWAYEKHNMENYSSVSAEDKFSTSVETPWRSAVFQPVQVRIYYSVAVIRGADKWLSPVPSMGFDIFKFRISRVDHRSCRAFTA